MLFLLCVLAFTTLLCCYAGYIFLVVDRRQQKQLEENPDLYNELDDKEYKFELPIEVEEYDDLRLSKPTDKCVLSCPRMGHALTISAQHAPMCPRIPGRSRSSSRRFSGHVVAPCC